MIATFLGALMALQQLELQQADIQKGKTSTLGAYILSDDYHVRQRAYRYAICNVIGIKRQEMKPFLLHVIRTDPLMPPRKGPINGDDATFSPRRVALSILAEWHEADFIPVFIDYVDYYAIDPNGSRWTPIPPRVTYVAMKGLINIGKPAVLPCLRELAKTENSPEWFRFQNPPPEAYRRGLERHHNFIMVIRDIVGDEEAMRLLTKEIHRIEKSDPEGARNLRSALDIITSTARSQPKSR